MMVVALGGCVDDESSLGAPTDADPGETPRSARDAFEATPPEPESDARGSDAAGSSSASGGQGNEAPAHGEPRREDGPVETGFDPLQGGFHASQTITISNDFGGAAWATMTIQNSAGDVNVQPWDRADYLVTAILTARGTTEQDARDNLASMRLVHEDKLLSDRLVLATAVEREDQWTPVVTINLRMLRTASILVQVPASPGYDVHVDTSSADISIGDLSGGDFVVDTSSGDASATGILAEKFVFDTSSGDIKFDGRADTIVGDTSSGSVSIDAIVNELVIDSSSGTVTVDARPADSGRFFVDSSSGDVALTVPAAERHGYRVLAESSSGDIHVDLQGTQPEGPQDEDAVHVVTTDLEARSIQTIILVGTSSGSIDVTN